MSIVTKTGDAGTTGLMYGRRVPKNHPRVEACGSLDELNAALGLARASVTAPAASLVQPQLLWIQLRLVDVMGEVGVATEDLPRYVGQGYGVVTVEFTRQLEDWVRELEARNLSFKGWATPGANPGSAALDLARTICRRAERRVLDLQMAGELSNPEVLIFLNRLADLLWLLARWAEAPSAGAPAGPVAAGGQPAPGAI